MLKGSQNDFQRQMLLIGSIAYDLRDPTAVILMAKESIEKYMQQNLSQEEQKRCQTPLKYIEQSVERLERISMNLLDISRFAMGNLTPQMQPLCISDACREICELASKYHPNRNIVCNLPKHSVVMVTDSYFFDRILLNLLSNAVVAAPNGKISVDLKEYAQEVVLIVTDTGAGLSPEQLERPFAPIYRMEDSGTKLGLYICSLMAKQLNATLSVENMPKGGARFVLKIPVQQNAQQAFLAHNPKQDTQRRARCVEVEFSGLEL